MAIYNNLEGTMKSTFSIGKGGPALTTTSSELTVSIGGSEELYLTDNAIRLGGSSSAGSTWETIDTSIVSFKAAHDSVDHEFQFGKRGIDATTPNSDVYVSAAGWRDASTSNNRTGTNLILEPGPGTGNAAGRAVQVYKVDEGSSGTAVQATSVHTSFLNDESIRIGASASVGCSWTRISSFVVNFKAGHSTIDHEFWFGKIGDGSITPQTGGDTIIAASGWRVASTSDNMSGTSLVLEAGPSTGNNTTNGDIFMNTPTAGSSGTAVQATATRFTFFREGEFRILSAGSESLPAIAVNNETDTGLYASAANQVDLTISGANALNIQRGSQDIWQYGKAGSGSITPTPYRVNIRGWTSASTSNDQIGSSYIAYAGKGTGKGASGGYEWWTWTVGLTGTTPHSSATQAMTLSYLGNLALQKSDDVQIYIGNSVAKPTSLDGPALCMPAVTTEPTNVSSSVAAIYWFGNALKVIDPSGSVKTVTLT